MNSEPITIFMCGDVMTGRGIDQILPHPVPPNIYEPYLKSAYGYVELAERANGPIPKPVEFDYVWGEALQVLASLRPDLRLINLETSVTSSESYWPRKGINYRMSPANFPAIATAGIDICTLANNHVLDWGYPGLGETIDTLNAAGIVGVGAGPDLAGAKAPATVTVAGKGRVHVFAFGDVSSGIPVAWGAKAGRPGVNLLPDLSKWTVRVIGDQVRQVRKGNDLVVASIHWGGNWGFEIPPEQKEFAHRLIDEAGVDVVHGHSSHHVKGIEVYRGRPILYGCGDFINDYEGISGYEMFRGDLGVMYFATMDPGTRTLVRMRLVPTLMRQFRIHRAPDEGVEWIRGTLNREGKTLGTWTEVGEERMLELVSR